MRQTSLPFLLPLLRAEISKGQALEGDVGQKSISSSFSVLLEQRFSWDKHWKEVLDSVPRFQVPDSPRVC